MRLRFGKNKRYTVVKKKKKWQDHACRFEITLFMAYVVNQSVPSLKVKWKEEA